MQLRYQFKYKETLEVITEMMKLHGISKVSKNYRMIVTFGGIMVFVFAYFFSEFFAGDPTQKTKAFIKFIILWALAYVLGEIFARTLGKKIEILSSTGDANMLFEKRAQVHQGPLALNIKFYDEYFISYANKNEKKIYYNKVHRILQSSKSVAFIVEGEEFGERFFAIYKDGIVDADIESFLDFLKERCPQVKKGIETVNV